MKNFKKTVTAFLVFAMLGSFAPDRAGAAASGSSAGVVSSSVYYLNVRSSASASSAIRTYLSSGTYVTLLSKSGGWWKVEYGNGLYGYCSAAYIKTVSGSYASSVNIGSGVLYVRAGPGTSYGVGASLSKGTYVVVLSASGNWSRVLYNGTKTGYVYSAYLAASGSAYSAVSLSVPSYKQRDSRWSSTPVGGSGRTIGDIGCSTVALAMAESYRAGSNIYPGAMVSRLRYTPDGSIYWPTDYTSYSGGDYLSMAYSLLRNGRPVLIGAKTASGGQHWAVITGFTGAASLTASAFAVNDPGSSSRTTLQQLFSAYPYFYKIMYYG